MNLIINLKHNPAIALKQHTEVWNYVWKKKIISVIISLFFFLAMLCISVFQISDGNKIGFFILGFSIFGIIGYVDYLFKARKSKNKYFGSLANLTKKHAEVGGEITYVFNDEFFTYKDFRFDLKISWSQISKHFIKGKSIYFYFESSIAVVFCLDEAEVGIDNFQPIENFITSKVIENSPQVN